jgi:regulator of protease activity HflC (stomatin/prohibitin superfamily)
MFDKIEEYLTQVNSLKIGLIGLGLIIVVSLMFSAFYTIDAGERGIVTRLGAIDRVASEGLNFKIPIIEDATKYNIRVIKAEVEGSAGTKDMQDVRTAIALNYRLDSSDEGIKYFYANIRSNVLDTIIQPNINESFKAVIARYKVDELLANRENVKSEITENIKAKLKPYHIIVDNVSITSFLFSEQFNKAIEAKQVAEQDALTAKNKLEQVKVEAEQKIASARAEAESLKLQKQEITPMLLELRKTEVQKAMIDKWDGQGAIVPQVVLGQGQGTILNLK